MRFPGGAAAHEKTNRVAYAPVAMAGVPVGPESSGVTNFEPIAGIAFRKVMSPVGNSTVVIEASFSRSPMRRKVGHALTTVQLPDEELKRAHRMPAK